MALGDIQWLQWKTKRGQAKDDEEYAAWAFPYGDEQKEKIFGILSELMPDEIREVSMVCFLTAKEIVGRYHKIFDMPEHRDYALECMNKDFKGYKRLFRNKEHIKLCCARSFVDIEITEELQYPPAEVVRRKAEEIGDELARVLQK